MEIFLCFVLICVSFESFGQGEREKDISNVAFALRSRICVERRTNDSGLAVKNIEIIWGKNYTFTYF